MTSKIPELKLGAKCWVRIPYEKAGVGLREAKIIMIKELKSSTEIAVSLVDIAIEWWIILIKVDGKITIVSDDTFEFKIKNTPISRIKINNFY